MEQNKMASMPMKKLVLKSSIPVMFSLALQAVYNIVDSAFVSNMATYGEEGVNALTLAFPVQMLVIALCIGTGVGAAVLISRFLGENKDKQAVQVTNNTLMLGMALTAITMLFGVFGVNAYISSQTSNEIIYEMAVEYLQINCIVSFGCVFFLMFEKLLQSTGHSLHSTIAQIAGAVVNIVLDPILIYGLLGFDAMGVRGAAYATVIGQIVACVVAFILHLRVNKHISGSLRENRLSWAIVKRIYIIGFPAIVAQALTSVMAYALNIIFVLASETIVTVYGLFYKIQQFVIMIVYGLRDACMPILSFTFGTRNGDRLKECVKYLMIYTLAIMLIGTVLFEVLAQPITSAFGLSGSATELFVLAVRLISLSFVFAGFSIACQTVFQSLGGGVQSLVISICRQILFVLPVAYLFTQLAITDSSYMWTVWLTFIIAEVLTAVIALVLLRKELQSKKIRSLYEEVEQSPAV